MSLSSMATARTCNYINHHPVLVGRCSLLRWFRDTIYYCLKTIFCNLTEMVHAVALQLKYAT